MKKIILLVSLIFSLTVQAENKNQSIYAEVTGQGNPIIFVPGFTVPGEIWKPTVKQLAANYECHVITLAGFNGKAPTEFPWLSKVNQSLKDYIVKNDLQNVTIIGHSLGGTIATWLASNLESRLSKIILVDALPAAGAMMFPNFNPDNMVYDNPYNKRQLNMNDEEFEQMADMMSKGMSLKKSGQESIKKWILAADRKTYVYGYTDYLKLDLREDLKKITIPVTIIAAAKPYGKEMATKTYKEQYKNLKDYDFIMADDAAHFIMLDRPDWFMQQIQNALTVK